MQTFNAFVEDFVLSDNIIIPIHDFEHINLSIPFFANGRPILDMLIQNKNLKAIFEGPEHLKDSIGEVIYVFTLKENETLNSNHEWFENYNANVDRSNFSKLSMVYKDNQIPNSTPLLLIGGDNTDKAIVIAEREIDKCLRSVISTTLGTRLNPLLPCFASKMQIEFYNKNRISYELYKLITKNIN